MLTRADQYTMTISMALDIVHDEPLELKLQYLIEIKASATSIVIVLADWHAFKAHLTTNASTMMKVLAFDDPPARTST